MAVSKLKIDNSLNNLIDQIKKQNLNNKSKNKLKLGSPASDQSISKLEKFWNVKLPNSYKELLKIHDGIIGLKYPNHLFSTSDILSKKPNLSKFINSWKKSENLEHVLVIGIVDTATNWILYLDPKKNKNNEMLVVEWTPSESFYYKNIVDFIQESLKTWSENEKKNTVKKVPQLKSIKVNAVAVTNENMIVVGLNSKMERKISLWSFDEKWIRDIGESDWPYYDIHSIDISPKYTQVAFERYGGAHIIDLESGKDQLEKSKICSSNVRSIVHKPNGNLLITKNENAINTVWELEANNFAGNKLDISNLSKKSIRPDACLKVAKNGNMLFSCYGENISMIVCNSHFNLIYKVQSNTNLWSIFLSDDGSKLICSYKSGKFEIVDLPSGKIIKEFQTQVSCNIINMVSDNRLIRGLCFVSSEKSWYFIIWDWSGKEILRKKLFAGKPKTSGFCLETSPDGKHSVAVINGKINIISNDKSL